MKFVDLNEEPSGLQKHLGYQLTAFEQDFCALIQPMTPQIMNRNGIPHGGVLSTLLDTAMGFAGCYVGPNAEPHRVMTLNLSVNFIAQATGTTLHTQGRRIGGGRKTYFAESSITDDAGTLIATATGVFKYSWINPLAAG